jgi:Tannase and feruloyl esterase
MRIPLLFCLASVSVWAAGPVKPCVDLAKISYGADIKLDSATAVAAANGVPAHCEVRGTILPEAKFSVKLPTDWNERFQMVGGGGFTGVISFEAMDQALKGGYATTSTDTGHDAKKEPIALFAQPRPDNPDAERKLVDYAYLAVHNTAVLAKRIITDYYGKAPVFSYWNGCSTGGRQGLMEALRYPEDFDGYVIGAPVQYFSLTNMRGVFNQLAIGEGPGKIAANKMPALADAVYGKCDAADGLKDGLIDDPRWCNFDPTTDLKRCTANDERADCFTTPQVEGLRKLYRGMRGASGTLYFPGQPVSAEVIAPGPRGPASGWMGMLIGEPSGGFAYGESAMKHMSFRPLEANWDYRTLDLDRDIPRMAHLAAKTDAINPDLSGVKYRGSKIVHYHGWADALVNPAGSVMYYENVLRTMGDAETKDFYRFYPVPGMFHCRGGVGCDNVDWLGAVVNWVEKGPAPNALIGKHDEGSKTTRTRPLCPYPQVSRYKGTGSIDEAANFECLAP